MDGRTPVEPASVSEDAGSALRAGPRYRRLTREDLQVIAYRHVRGASDGEIARELSIDRSSIDRSSVRRARKRPAGLELIAAERKREAKRAESQRYRDRKKQQREIAARALPEAQQAAEVGPQVSALGAPPESAPPDEQPDDPGPPIAPEYGRVATGPSRHVPPLELEPFSNDWFAWYAERRHLSEIDMLNCNDAWRGIVPPLERRARERGPRPSIRK